MISVCVAVHRVHAPPNVASLRAQLDAALGGEQGELVLALNGVDLGSLGVAGEVVRSVDLEVNRGVAPAWNAAAREARGRGDGLLQRRRVPRRALARAPG